MQGESRTREPKNCCIKKNCSAKQWFVLLTFTFEEHGILTSIALQSAPPQKNIYIVKQHNQHKITEMKAINFGFEAIDGRRLDNAIR